MYFEWCSFVMLRNHPRLLCEKPAHMVVGLRPLKVQFQYGTGPDVRNTLDGNSLDTWSQHCHRVKYARQYLHFRIYKNCTCFLRGIAPSSFKSVTTFDTGCSATSTTAKYTTQISKYLSMTRNKNRSNISRRDKICILIKIM